MGVSFKVSKTGRRYQPKPSANYSAEDESTGDDVIASTTKDVKSTGDAASEKTGVAKIAETEASFTLSLFPEGYTVGKYVENNSAHQAPIEVPKNLHPYNRASETLFSAIESGLLPRDMLDDIPCRFIDGTVVCEVRDYRKCFPESPSAAPGDVSPIVNTVRLRMSLENVIKDMPAISDNSWTYGDLMEVESRIVKVLQPQLCLDPSPKLSKLADKPGPAKLNFDLRSMRRKRWRQIPEVALYSNNIQGKRVLIDRASENSNSGSLMQQQPGFENMNSQNNISSAMLPQRNNSFGSDGSLLMSQQSKYQIGPASPRLMKDQRSGSFSNASVASPGGHDMAIPFSDNTVSGAAASFHGKRDQPEGQPSPLVNKKARLTPSGVEGNPQHMGPQMDNLHRSDAQWKNQLLQQQAMGRGIQFANNGMQKLPQHVFDGGVTREGSPMSFSMGKQQGIGYNLKEEPIEMERPEQSRMHMSHSDFSGLTDSHQPRAQQRMHPLYMRSGLPQTPWNNLGQPLDSNSRNEEKMKLVQSPRMSAGGLPQSPLSSKSGEFSSGSIGHQFGPVANSGFNQNDKSVATSVLPVGVSNTSLTSGANESLQRQNQTQTAGKRRSYSLSKTPTMGGVGSPASVSNMSVPINANSPSVGNQPFGDHAMLERFSKIEMVTMRCQLNRKKNKVDQLRMTQAKNFSPQLVAAAFSDPNFDNLKEDTCEMPLSKSLVGGNMNVCKIRIVNVVQTERVFQGNSMHIVPKGRTRMIMSEKPSDGHVAFHIGEIEDAEYLAAEDHLPTLPNTDIADRLAAQFYSLMKREGSEVEDNVQPRPAVRPNPPSSNVPLGSPSAEAQQIQEGVSVQQPNDIARPTTSANAPFTTPQHNQRMLPPGNAQQIQISQAQGISAQSRPQQTEQQVPPMQQQQQQQNPPQFQRSPSMLPANSMQHMPQNANNIQMGSNMTNKPSPLQLQILQQQQQQQQQQAQIQRKMMSGLGSVAMGSIGNNMVGLGGLNNVMGMGGVRGVAGGPGISGPMGSISGLGNVGQSNIMSASNLTNALRSGTLTPAQAAIIKMRFAQNRSNIMGGAQSSIAGMSGARQMHPGTSGLSMLGPGLNRANLNQMQQRTAMGQMGPPKMTPGMNMYAGQSQQLQQLQQQQQIQMLQQQQQQQQQIPMQQQQIQQMQTQQETASPLQSAVVTPPPVGSPSTSSMGVASQMNNQPQQQQQQQASPQQIGGQRTPMSPQVSSGAIQQMGGGAAAAPSAANNAEACPASPQLSAQTMGSVGSITNSSVDAQAVNKSNSANNA